MYKCCVVKDVRLYQKGKYLKVDFPVGNWEKKLSYKYEGSLQANVQHFAIKIIVQNAYLVGYKVAH